MSNVRIGWTGGYLKERLNSPSIKKTDNGPEVTHIYDTNYATAEAAIAAYGVNFGDPHPAPYASAVLVEIGIQKDGPKNAIVTYLYRQTTGSGEVIPPVGTITREIDSNVIEIPIGQNSNASGTNYDKEKKVGVGDWEGIEAELSPQPVYKRQEILSSFTFSETEAVKNVAKRFNSAQMNAKGLSGATTNKWLKMSLNVREVGEKFEMTETWQYAEKGWKTDIYDAAT